MKKSAKKSAAKSTGFTDVEREAMKARAQEMKAEARFGFQDPASLDEGAMWPVAFAVKALTPADEARIGELVKKAVS